MPFDLKPISREGVPAALRKAERYRLINDPSSAESICRDVLTVDPGNQQALVTLLLAITDQFAGAPTEGNDESILRWNTCVRLLARHEHLKPRAEERVELTLE
jgi:hypothetical protein